MTLGGCGCNTGFCDCYDIGRQDGHQAEAVARKDERRKILEAVELLQHDVAFSNQMVFGFNQAIVEVVKILDEDI